MSYLKEPKNKIIYSIIIEIMLYVLAPLFLLRDAICDNENRTVFRAIQTQAWFVHMSNS